MGGRRFYSLRPSHLFPFILLLSLALFGVKDTLTPVKKGYTNQKFEHNSYFLLVLLAKSSQNKLWCASIQAQSVLCHKCYE